MRYLITMSLAVVFFYLSGCAGAIVELPEEKKLDNAELKAALTGDDFRQKTAARKQIETLPPAERLELLQELVQSTGAPTRLLAVSELAKLPPDVHKPVLEKVHKEDADPEVREFAGAVIGIEPPDDDDDDDDDDDEEDDE